MKVENELSLKSDLKVAVPPNQPSEVSLYYNVAKLLEFLKVFPMLLYLLL